MRTLRLIALVWFMLAIWLGTARAQAQPLDESTMPPELNPWLPWVLESVPDRDCRTIGGEIVCAWPGVLRLEVEARGGRFELEAALDREADLALPGSAEHWPEDVQVDGRAAVVLVKEGAPYTRLPRGQHVLRGSFVWEELPESLALPRAIARVALRLDGKDVVFPKREASGALWLSSGAAAARETETLHVELYRRIDDGVPLLVTTQIALRVSGRAREHDFGRVLLDGTVPLSIKSELPARLEAGGALHAQLRSGAHTIEVVARSETAVETLAPRQLAAPWPSEEVWVWAAKPYLREVEISGAPSIDPSRTNLPDEWRALPAYLLTTGVSSLKLKTTRRGQPDAAPNQLHLSRRMWLDSNGGGFTVRDEFSGKMQRGWRLNLASGELGRAAVDGVDQLITIDKDGQRGVELRQRELQMMAESRLPRLGETLAVGWNEDVQSLRTILTLPPGYRLFTARGVDRVPDTWISQWDLWSFFFVLVLVVAVARLSTPGWAAVLFFALVLCHGEAGAPRYVWIALFALWALLRIVPSGRFRGLLRLAWLGTALLFAGIALSFVVDQVRWALYPQLRPADDETIAATVSTLHFARAPGVALESAPEPPADLPKAATGSEIDRRGSLSGVAGAPALKDEEQRLRRLVQQDPNAVIQTGPGLPTWSFRSWELGWNGPVDQKHRLRLYLISPTIERLLTVARVILLLLLALFVFRLTPHGREPTNFRRRSSGKVAPALGLFALVAGLGLAPDARAEMPSPELIEELTRRATHPAPCEPNCAHVSSAELNIEGRRLRALLDVHAGSKTSIRLPGPAASWVFETLTVDGAPAVAVALLADGFLHLRLEPGRHRVVVEGRIAGDDLDLALPDVPERVSVTAPGWAVEGVREDGRTAGSLHLSRAAGTEAGDEPSGAPNHSLPPWFEIERRVQVGVLWTIQSKLKRVSPVGAPAVVRFPLLAGEAVTSADRVVEAGRIVLSLGRDQTEASWESTLSAREVLKLLAPERVPWTEVWVLECGVIFQCAPRGLPPVQQVDTKGRYEPMYRPWPGESVEIAFARPAAAPGTSITIDNASYHVTPGSRLMNGKLSLSLRSSSGGLQKIKLPSGAKLQRLVVKGEERALRQEGDQVIVALQTGAQGLELEFQLPGGLASFFRVPAIDLGRSFVNARVNVQLPPDRWLLFAGGPIWGPAILFWGYVVVVVLAGLLLGRIPLSPLKNWQWILLGLGLTQVPAAVAICIAGWFFLMSFRSRKTWQRRRVHNLFQILLALVTLVVLVMMAFAVYRGLVVQPDMQVAGNDNTEQNLSWYLDRAGPLTPSPWVLSLPLWTFRILMLAWALWAAASWVGWLRWGYAAFASGGAWLARPPAPEPSPGPEPGTKPAASPKADETEPEDPIEG